MRSWIAAGAFALCACSSGEFCIARGSRVLTPDGPRSIEDLAIGDAVYSVDEHTGELHATRVIAIQTATREVGRIAFGDSELRATSNHPLFCPRERCYRPAGDWFLGNRTALARVDGGVTSIVVSQREVYVGISEVFDITVAHELHNFIVNGVIVHNKSPPPPECDFGEQKEGDTCMCPNGDDGGLSCRDRGVYKEIECACESDLFAPCPPDQRKGTTVCSPEGTNQSCAVAWDFCETGSCGRFEDSSPFCTRECSSDDDCDNGTCAEFIPESGAQFCAKPS